ncbi:MAG: hypothetical protein BZ136_01025 [Methanosphaera sp. rholeuAM74]|nr:MAG: hypothetical protein BZ136_01025 [Methanosphaera sp. rholeuAM74]
MSLFNSICVDNQLIPYIERHLAVGIIKYDGFGKCSVVANTDKILVKSYDNPHQQVHISMDKIEYIRYEGGDFLFEPRITIVAKSLTYTIKGYDNNDVELRAFYDTILEIKRTGRVPEQVTTKENTHKSYREIDPAVEIRKFYQLYVDGIISKQEFDRKKEELLNII